MINNKFELKDKIFLITGATSGIGYATVRLLFDMGCKVYAIGRNEKVLDELTILGNGRIVSIKADLMVADSLNIIADNVNEKIHGFVHSAGAVKSMPLNFITQEYLDSERKLNYDVFLFLVKLLVKKRKFHLNASIVPLSSIVAHYGMNGLAVYSATKGAMVSTVRVFAKELAAQRIRVNSISPGMVRTEMVDRFANDVTNEALLIDEKKYPLGYGKPIDVAYTVAFLLSEASSWMTGQDIILDGGRTCYV